MLTRPLPDDKKLITLGVVEPFTTAVKVSMAAAFAVTLPLLLYQLWAFLAPALEEGTQRTVALFATFATILFAGGVAFSYFIVLPRALSFLTSFGEEFFQVEIRASYYFSFVTLTLLASGLAFQMPIFILALVRLRVLTADRLRRNRRIGIALMLVFAVLLPTVDPVSLAARGGAARSSSSSSRSSSRPFMEKRWDIADQKSPGRPSEGPLRRLGAAGGGRADRERRRRDRGRRSSPRSGRRAELGEGERFPDSAIVPGFVNAHTHLEYAVYAGFGDGLSFGPWISTHVERKRRLDRPAMEAIARLGAAECLRSGITTVGDLAFTGASAHACAELGLRAIVYLEVFGSAGAEALRQFEEKRAYVAAGALGARPRRRLPARALHLLARGLRRRARPRPARGDAPERERRTSSTGCCAAKVPGSRSPRCWSSPSGRAGSAASRRPGCSTSASSLRTA